MMDQIIDDFKTDENDKPSMEKILNEQSDKYLDIQALVAKKLYFSLVYFSSAYFNFCKALTWLVKSCPGTVVSRMPISYACSQVVISFFSFS